MALNKTMKMATTSAVALGLATVASSDAMAQSETVNATVSATVQNAFDLTQTTAMNFGTLAAFADTAGTKTASISVTTAGFGRTDKQRPCAVCCGRQCAR